MALPSFILTLVGFLMITTVGVSTAYNITEILSEHPEFSTFNKYLTKTHLANEINHRETITVLALDNSAMSDLVSKGYSLGTLRNVLSLHILVDYYGSKKLHQVTDRSTTTASMFQATGDAEGTSGYVNITDIHGGKVGFSPADADGLQSYFVKSVVEMPYNLSVIQISQLLDSAEAEAPTPDPSSINLITSLGSKGCKEFAGLLSSSGALKTFQENIETGLTVFCVGDNAVKSFMPKYNSLTAGNKTALLLYHGIAVYESMGMLKYNNGVVTTLATDGVNKYVFTVQTDGDFVTLKTKVVTAKVMGTLIDRDPISAYKLDKFLVPHELFSASEFADEALAPSDDDVADSTSKKHKNSAGKISGLGFIAVGFAAFLFM